MHAVASKNWSAIARSRQPNIEHGGPSGERCPKAFEECASCLPWTDKHGKGVGDERARLGPNGAEPRRRRFRRQGMVARIGGDRADHGAPGANLAGADRIYLRRGQPPHHGRSRNLLSQRRWHIDADPQGPTAAGFEKFRSAAEMTAIASRQHGGRPDLQDETCYHSFHCMGNDPRRKVRWQSPLEGGNS
jgi:hypothetical protein